MDINLLKKDEDILRYMKKYIQLAEKSSAANESSTVIQKNEF